MSPSAAVWLMDVFLMLSGTEGWDQALDTQTVLVIRIIYFCFFSFLVDDNKNLDYQQTYPLKQKK